MLSFIKGLINFIETIGVMRGLPDSQIRILPRFTRRLQTLSCRDYRNSKQTTQVICDQDQKRGLDSLIVQIQNLVSGIGSCVTDPHINSLVSGGVCCDAGKERGRTDSWV